MKTKVLLLFLLVCLNNSATAQELAKLTKTILLDSPVERLSIMEHTAVLVDSTGMSLAEMQQQDFVPLTTLEDFDYRQTHWLRFSLHNLRRDSIALYYPLAVIDSSNIGRIRIPVLYAKLYKTPTRLIQSAGRLSGIWDASFPPHQQYLELDLRPNETATYYLQLQYDWRDFDSKHRLNPMLLSKAELEQAERHYQQLSQSTSMFRFAFLAIALMISLINLIQFFLNRDKAYLMYACYTFGMFCLYALKYEEALAFSNRLFFGKYLGGWYNYLDIIFFQSIFFSQFLFYRYFFHTKQSYPSFDSRISFGLRLLMGVFLIDILSYTLLGNSQAFGLIHTLLPLLLLPYILYLIYMVYTFQTRLSAIIVTGSLLLILTSSFGIVAQFFPRNLLQNLPFLLQDSDNYSPLGAIMEFILFSVALGYRVGAVERKNMELENAKQIAELRRQFYTDITHEFRTPLTLIISPLQAMLAGTFQGNIQHYQKMMLRNAERLLELINQLLDLSKLEAGELRLQANRADLVAVVRALAMSFESLAMRKQIELQLDLPNMPIQADFDRDKMEKVISNLLSNAFKFTPEEGKIVVYLRAENGQVYLQVQDSGIGIPAVQIPHIFKRFYQVENGTSQRQAGSGVGLALVKEIIELHRGTIEVQSEEHKGTSVRVCFPIDSEHLSEPKEMGALSDEEGVQKSIVPERLMDDFATKSDKDLPILLVAEDNADVRRYVADQLKASYQILEAADGKVGLNLALEHIPDLIISDIMMPEMDGMTLCKYLKANEKTNHIPIILLTAKADRRDRLEGLQIGADDYLTKPFDSQELLIRVKNLVDQRRQLIARFSKIGSLSIKPVKAVSPEEVFLQKAVGIVQKHLEDEDFGVVELASAMLMSRHQLHRKIKALTDRSPSVFIRSLRLQESKRLLQQGEYTVSEVAFRLGFSSLAYFSKCFAQEFDQPPSTFIASGKH